MERLARLVILLLSFTLVLILSHGVQVRSCERCNEQANRQQPGAENKCWRGGLASPSLFLGCHVGV